MDSDDICRVKRIELQMQYLIENGLDFVASDIDLMDSKQNPISYPHIRTNIQGKRLAKIESNLNVFWHPTWLMKREVMSEVGGYRNIPSAEDYDFVIRAILKGYSLGILAKPLVIKRMNPGSISESDNYRQVVYAETLRKNFKKHNIINLDDLPKINLKSKQTYAIIKNSFDNRNVKKINTFRLIWQLIFRSEGRMLLKTILVAKYQMKTI